MSKKKMILIAICVVAAVVGGLFYYVTHIDWNAQKENIAARFSKTSGRKIEFTGNLSVSLFPSPHLEASDVNILNDETSEKLATVATLEAELSLRALLKGIPDIQSMTLIGSEFWFIVDENGVSNWHQKQKSELLDMDLETGLQKLNVRNSLVHYRNKKYEFNQELTQVNAEILAKSLVGPYRLDGNFVKDSDHFGVAVNIGDFSQADDVSVSFALTHPNSESFLRYDGTYNFLTGNFKGDLSGNAKRAADFINIVFGQPWLSDEFNRQLLFSVTTESDKKALKLSSFAIKFSDYVEGSGQIDIPWPTAEEAHPLITLQYQMVNVDVQPLLLRLHQHIKNWQQQNKYAPDWPYNVQFDLESERVILSNKPGGFVENVSAKGTWQNNELNIDEAYIACPGNIVLTLSGNVRAENDLPRYFAKVKFEGKHLLEFLNTFGAEITPPNQSAYRNINLEFNLIGNPLVGTLNETKLTLDKAHYQMTGQYDLTTEKPTFQLNVTADKVNFDNYLPAQDASLDTKQAFDADLQKLATLRSNNWKIDFITDSAVIRGVPYNGFGFQLSTEDNILHLVDVKADDVLGAKIRLSADIGNLDSDSLVIRALEYDISTSDISPILTKLQLNLPYPDLYKNKNFQSSGNFKGNSEQTDANLNAKIGNLQFSYSGNIDRQQEIHLDGHGEIKTINLGELINNLGSEFKKLTNNSVFNCAGNIKGHSANWQLSDLDCVLGTAQYSGNLDIKTSETLTDISGDIKASEFDLSMVLDIKSEGKKTAAKTAQNTFLNKPNWKDDTVNYDFFKNKVIDLKLDTDKAFYENALFNRLTAHVQNNANVLTLEDLSFEYKNADYSGAVQINYADTPKISGNIRGGNIRLSNIGGSIYKVTDGNLNFSTTFSANATSEAAFMNSITGILEFVIDSLNMNGFDFSAIVKDLQAREYAKGLFQVVHDSLQSGYTYFENLTGQVEISNGAINFNSLVLKNNDVTIIPTGQAQIASWQTENQWTVTLNQRPDVPAFTFSLNGAIDKPTLEIKIDDIVKKYDEFWEKEAAVKRQKQEAEQREKERLMQNAQQQVSKALDKLKTVNEAYLQSRNLTTLPASIAQYDKYLNRLEAIKTALSDLQSLPQRQNYQNEDSQKIEQQAQQYLEEMQDIEAERQPLYEEDVRARFAATKDTVQSMKDNNTAFYDSYQKMLQDKFAELRNYKSISYMLNNNDLLDMQRQIDQLRNDFWEKCYQFSDKFTQYIGIEKIEDIEDATANLQKNIDDIAYIQNQMNDLQQTMEKQLDTIIAERKKVFEEEEAKAAEEEAARLAKEEAEQAALKRAAEKVQAKTETKENLTPEPFKKSTSQKDDTDKSVQSDTKADLQKVKNQNTLQTLDNILINNEVSGTITKSYEDVPEYKLPGLGILEPIEGSMPETSGKIIVK